MAIIMNSAFLPLAISLLLLGGVMTTRADTFKVSQDLSKTSKYESAERMANAGKYRKAVNIYLELIDEYPGNEIVLNNIAGLYNKLGEYDKASRYYAKMFRMETVRLRREGQADLSPKALQIYRRINALDHRNPSIYVDIAHDLMNMNKLEWARAELKKALKIDPECSGAYYSLGKYYRIKNDAYAAVRCLKKAVSCNPNNYYALNDLGGIYIKMNRLKKAKEQFRKAIAIKVDNSLSYYNLGVVCMLTGEPREAADNFKNAIKYNPNNYKPYYMLANLYYDAFKDYKSAYPIYIKVLDMQGYLQGYEVLDVQKRISEIQRHLDSHDYKPGEIPSEPVRNITHGD